MKVLLSRDAVLLLVALATACSSAPKKDRASVCENDDCESSDDNKKKTGSKDNGGPSGSPLEPTKEQPDAGGEPIPDAGTDSGPSAGASCAALAECCDALTEAGITGSANQCRRIVSDGNELSCQLAHEDYKKPDEFYDPVCF